jgi:riboflavin synthase
VTTLGTRQPGDLVNLEVDVMAKQVEKLILHHLGRLSGTSKAEPTV